MAARARERRETAEAVIRAEQEAADAEQEAADARELAEFLVTVPPPCPNCYRTFRAWSNRALMWEHVRSGTDEAEGFPMNVCTCECHPEPVRWLMIALAY